MKKSAYIFGGKKAEGGEKLRNFLIVLTVEMVISEYRFFGFTITTEACVYFYQHKMTFLMGLSEEVL